MQCGLKAPARAPVERVRWIWRRGPGCRRRSGQSGFSLVETMIAAAILSILLMALMVVLVQAQDTFDTLATRSSTQMRIQGTLDGMSKKMRSASQGNLTTGYPPQFLVEGQSYSNITFIPVANVLQGYIVWDDPVTYWFQYDPGEEATLGADDDGDGLEDEGTLFRSQAGSDIPLCSRVTGVRFSLASGQLSVSLTAAAVDGKGYVHQFTGQSSISFRNQ